MQEHIDNTGTEEQRDEEFFQQEEALNEEGAEAVETAGGQEEIDQLKLQLEDAKDKHLRLYSEFENFRRRTTRERAELIKTSTEDLIVDLLPVLDDFDRADQLELNEHDLESFAQGFTLIHQKLNNTLTGKGLKPMNVEKGMEFDAEMHEAISQIPAPSADLVGKIVDIVEKGYTLNDKVIRFAKVVIGA